VRLHTRSRQWTLALAILSTAAVLLLFYLHSAWGWWALAGMFLCWLGLEHIHSAATTRLLRVALASARKLEWQVIRDPDGNFAGHSDRGVCNVTTPVRSSNPPP